MWCVVADNGDEFWVYGPFLNENDAKKCAEICEENCPETVGGRVEYTVADFIKNEDTVIYERKPPYG